jgi:SAM-dependent methyltransferase
MQRSPHAALNLQGRWPKAVKIERLLHLDDSAKRSFRLLEIGTGSGAIAHYFACRSGLRCDVDAVDVVDQRKVRDGYEFQLVRDTTLPFETARFDIVISNHVIEHVGDSGAQLRHLGEIHRVLRPDGRAYLAVPNRWQVVEPHFHLPFLSWLPRRLRDSYVRLARRGARYDCEPPTLRTLETMLRDADFEFENVCVPALRETLAIERADSTLAGIFARIPDALLQRLRGVIPTLIYLLYPTPVVLAGAAKPIT